MVPELGEHRGRFRPANFADGRRRPCLHAVGKRINRFYVVDKDVRHPEPGRARGIVVKVHTALLARERFGGGVGVKRKMKIVVSLIGQANRARRAGLRVISNRVHAACVQIRLLLIGQPVHPELFVSFHDVGIKLLCGGTEE